MLLIDRHILGRFLTNFVILFALLFVFAAAIDVILSLDRFVEVSHDITGDGAGVFVRVLTVLRLALNFECPRFFQFYAYLNGLVAVGAMGFTLAQMHRDRELVASLAHGIGMHRLALPFIIGSFGLSALELLNQELILPRVAPLLLRDRGDIGLGGIRSFPIRFTPDGRDSLFQSPSFDPRRERLRDLTVLERDAAGRTVRRITAGEAVWSLREDLAPLPGGWTLRDGQSVTLRAEGEGAAEAPRLTEPVAFYPTDLSPRVLVVRRYSEYAAMLSLGQITQMIETPGVAEQRTMLHALLRHRYSRFSIVLVNVLVMWLTLPMFLLRQPANLLVRTILCAATAIPALLGAAIFMTVELPGISPAFGVFLPVVILMPVVLAQWTYVKT